MRPRGRPGRRAADRRDATTSSTPAPSRRTGRRRCCVPRRAAAAGSTRTTHLLATDPGGCWVAEDDAGLLGVAISFRRELLWCLASFAVRPGLQGRGIGRPLLEAALSHSQRLPARHAVGLARTPRPCAGYAAAGFALHPQMWLTGTVDRSRAPGRREGPRGQRRRHRADGLPRPAHPGRGARRPTTSLLVGAMPAARLRHRHRLGLRLRATRAAVRRSWRRSNRRTAARLLWAVLADAEDRRHDRTTSAAPTTGPSTSGWPRGSTCTRAATWRCAG